MLENRPLIPEGNMNTGRRLTGEGVYKIVKATVRAAGLEQDMEACHDLRRAFASHFAATNPGETYADSLRRQLGYARFSQTTEYIKHDVTVLRQHIVSPLALFERQAIA
jgi:site-specific recombinase XerD